MMNYNKWNNYNVNVGYLKYALSEYQRLASQHTNEYRVLTKKEIQELICCFLNTLEILPVQEAKKKALNGEWECDFHCITGTANQYNNDTCSKD